MAFNRTPPLDDRIERIKKIRADIETFIAARVAAIKQDCPGVPEGAIRNTLTRSGCECRSYLEITARDEKDDAA